MPATLIDIQIAQQRFDSVVLGWKPVGSAQAVASTFLEIKRSYAQNDGFVTIATVPASSMVYSDELSNKQQKWLNVFYKITTKDNGTVTKDYGPFDVLGDHNSVDRQIIRSVNLFLRNNGSTPCLIYQQAYGTESTRCPKCWDRELQQIIYYNCDVCFGTSYVGPVKGYYTPILTLVDIKPTPASNTLEDTVQAQNTTEARMANFPLLRPNDLIREINTGNIWTVTSVNRQVRARTVLSQDPISLRNIRPADIEYDLPIPSTLVPVLRRHRAVRERILVDNPNTAAQFIEVVV